MEATSSLQCAGWVERKRNPSISCAEGRWVSLPPSLAEPRRTRRSTHPTCFNRSRPTRHSRRRIVPAPRTVGHGQRRPRRIFIVVFLRVVALAGVVTLGSVVTLGIGGRAVDIDRPRGVGRSVLAIDRCRCAVGGIHAVRGLPISVTGFRVRPMGRCPDAHRRWRKARRFRRAPRRRMTGRWPRRPPSTGHRRPA